MNEGMSDDAIEARFFVHGRMEILDLLNDLIVRQQPVSVRFDGGQDGYVTTLLEARNKALIFELAADADANLHLMKCRACVFVAHPDGIQIQFSAGRARRFKWGDTDAFCVRLPRKVARLQRHESFRILIPAEHALRVELFSADGVSLGELPLHDLSIGGVGASTIDQPPPAFCQAIARIRLLLPEHGEIESSTTLRHVTCVADGENKPRYRIGLTFSGLLPDMGGAIQRYIIRIEQQRRTAAEDNGAGGED